VCVCNMLMKDSLPKFVAFNNTHNIPFLAVIVIAG